LPFSNSSFALQSPSSASRWRLSSFRHESPSASTVAPGTEGSEAHWKIERKLPLKRALAGRGGIRACNTAWRPPRALFEIGGISQPSRAESCPSYAGIKHLHERRLNIEDVNRVGDFDVAILAVPQRFRTT